MCPDRRRRILVVTSTFPRWSGDSEPSFVYTLSSRLQQKGYDVTVLAPHAKGLKLNETMGRVRVMRYRYFFSGLENLAYAGGILANLRKNPLNYLLVPFFLFFQSKYLLKLLRTDQFDLVHAHWIIPQGLLSVIVNNYLITRPVPVLCTSHGADLYALRNPLFRLLRKWTINKCAHLCVVSSAMEKTCFALGVDKSKLSTISMGVDLTNIFYPAAGVERKPERLIFVGRLVEKKGVQILIDAMQVIVAGNPDAELLVIGDGPLRKSIAAQVKDSGLSKNVVFKGAISNDQLPALYSSASVSVVPSIIDRQGDQEGLGLVMIEALGCGCAVVASSLEPIKDVIIDGVTGLLSTPGNSAELAEKIILLLTDSGLCRRIAGQGQESVRGKFDWDIICEKYDRLISSLCP